MTSVLVVRIPSEQEGGLKKVEDIDIILEQNRGGCLLKKQARLPTRVEVGGHEFVVEPVCPLCDLFFNNTQLHQCRGEESLVQIS